MANHPDETELDEDFDDDFDYDEFIANEFPRGRVSTSLHPLWKSVAVLLLVLFVLSILLTLA